VPIEHQTISPTKAHSEYEVRNLHQANPSKQIELKIKKKKKIFVSGFCNSTIII
jgi:D-arabinose 5-phosphate isomerase GutQ